ncbi:MAG: arylesterase [Rhodospirillales bacterium]
MRLLTLGDSLTAGFGLPAGQGFAAELERALKSGGVAVRVLDAGVSGDTTAGGLQRLDWALGDKPQAAIVELGANDMLRGLDPAAARANLDAILAKLRQRGVKTLLAGMLAAPNMGKDYAREFNAIYPALAQKHGVALYPFFLDGVAGEPGLLLSDGLHPNQRGVAEIVRRILPDVRRLLADAAKAE